MIIRMINFIYPDKTICTAQCWQWLCLPQVWKVFSSFPRVLSPHFWGGTPDDNI